MLRRVVGLVGVLLTLGLASGLLAGCGGPPDFVAGPGKVRISPVPAGHGQVNYPANVTVDGTGLYVFTHGVRQVEGKYELNVSVITDPGASGGPANHAVQGWLGAGDTLRVDGLVVTMLAVYQEQYEGDIQVTSANGDSATATASPS